MSQSCYDLDWFEKLAQIKVSFLRQVHNSVPKDTVIQTQSDIDVLFSYKNLKAINGNLHTSLQLLLEEIESDTEKPTAAKGLWLEKVHELLKLTSMLDTIYKANFCAVAPDMYTFEAHMNSLWNDIDPDIFLMTLAEAKIRLSKRGSSLVTSGKISFPGTEYAEYYANYARVHFDKKLKLDGDAPTEISLIDFKKRIEEALVAVGATDWKVRFDSRDRFGRFVVLGKSKLILLPEHTVHHDVVRYKRALKLLHHEVYTHVVRSEAGFNSRLRLLGLGLAKYNVAEEGIATFREQKVVASNKYFSGFLAYFAVGLAKGLDRNNVQRTPLEFVQLFTEVYIQLGIPSSLAHRKAVQKMFRVYIKLGEQYVINNFELIYREGNIKIHKLLSENSDVEKLFNFGKFDPGNQNHVASLSSLGVIG
jgi:hypothetical protein